jgi:hypothetical protein
LGFWKPLNIRKNLAVSYQLSALSSQSPAARIR